MLAQAGNEPRPFMPVGRPPQASTNIWGLDTSHNKHCLAAITRNADVACVHWGQGPQASCDIQKCQVWRGGLWRPKLSRIVTVKCDVAVCDDRNCSGLSQSSVTWRFVRTETVQDCHSQVWCGGLWQPKLFRIVTVKCDVAVCDDRNCSGLSQSSVMWWFVTTETVQDCHSQVWCGGLWRPKLFRIITVKCDVAVCDDRNCSGLSQSSVMWCLKQRKARQKILYWMVEQ